MGGKGGQKQMDFDTVSDSKLSGKTPKKVKLKVPSQEQVLGKIASAFQNKLERSGDLTTGKYLELLEKTTDRAQKVLEHMAEVYPPEKYPKSELKSFTRAELMQTLAERAELLSITKSLKARGTVKLSEELVGMLNRAKNVSDAQYADFLEKYFAGEKNLKLLLKDLPLTEAERTAIEGMLNKGDNLALLEAGRGFNALRGGKYPGRLGIRGWVWEKAKTVAKANLADVLGGSKWAVKRFTGFDPSAKLGEEIASEYTKKHAKITTRISPINAGKVLIGGGLLFGVGFLFSKCGSCMVDKFAGGSKEGERPAVKSRRKKTAVEAELFASGSTKFAYGELSTLISTSGIPTEEQGKVASILAKFPRQFIRTSDNSQLRKTVAVIHALLPLSSKKFSRDRIASTAQDILEYVDPAQVEVFAKALAKNAKSPKDIAAVFNSPPARFKMTEAWMRRPFAAFKEAGFNTERDEKVRLLCKAIRTTTVKKGRERVPIPAEQQGQYAEVLAAMYAPSGGRPRVPNTYQADLGFLVHLSGKGFSVEDSAEILATLKFVYKPGDLDKVADSIVKNLKPSMSEEEMRLVIEAPAFKNRGYANDVWEDSTDERLRRVLTEDESSKEFSKDLRELPQNLYEEALETLVSFTDTWQSERRVLTNKDITPLIDTIEYITRSKVLSRLTPDERGRILYKLATSLKEAATIEGERVKPRDLALKHISNTFKGKAPTEAQVMDSLDAFLEENPGFAL
ncbi:hypothetical protein GF412_01465 [Candidatus Micrarchaeota archaeon]|nr:hypothetical protein [Candidatus Micrarchaeota archaeon]MBD3417637.1 hypothetical protein [Candidatus Micrarchaeota archaeon]